MRSHWISHSCGHRTLALTLRRVGFAAVDSCSWIVALGLAYLLPYEFSFARLDVVGFVRMISVAVIATWITGMATRTYLGRYTTGSLDDALNVARVDAVVGLFLYGVAMTRVDPAIAPSVPLVATLFALTVSLGARLIVRTYRARRVRPSRSSARVIVYGAGIQGRDLVRTMLSGGDILPVALLDDDPALRHTRFSGVGVRGTGDRLAEVAAETRAQQLVIAFRRPSPARMCAVVAAARNAGLEVKIAAPLSERLRPWARCTDLRDLDLADLLGRKQIDTDLAAIADCLTGRKVLVTGAGGSIGSELCRQIHRFRPAELMMLDRDESALHAVQLSIHAEARLDSPNVILADIRDTEAMLSVFLRRRPDVVFHAAALKHVTVLERYPEEAWKTNVLGTLELLDAARRAGVRQFVNISTDKAVNPICVLGRSKRIGERLVAAAARRSDGTFLSVRFGNVLGSRGSVLTTFAEQLATGHPVTVTHPDVTRFFMTIPEAVQLVVQAAAIGSSGEALVLDMGEPSRITDLARMLMTMSGQQSEIVFTGLGKGEKLHEELFGAGEEDHRPVHPAISHIQVPALDPETVLACGAQLGPARAMAALVDERPHTTAASAKAAPAASNHVRVVAVARTSKEKGRP